MSYKIIFLDVDGVLHSVEARSKDLFYPECMKQLKRIYEEVQKTSKLYFVLSSAWRIAGGIDNICIPEQLVQGLMPYFGIQNESAESGRISSTMSLPPDFFHPTHPCTPFSCKGRDEDIKAWFKDVNKSSDCGVDISTSCWVALDDLDLSSLNVYELMKSDSTVAVRGDNKEEAKLILQRHVLTDELAGLTEKTADQTILLLMNVRNGDGSGGKNSLPAPSQSLNLQQLAAVPLQQRSRERRSELSKSLHDYLSLTWLMLSSENVAKDLILSKANMTKDFYVT